jgi:tetratricopeptide (TPR) repeat protein
MLRMVSYPHRPQSGHIMRYLNRTYHVLPTQRALELDAALAEAHASLAMINTWYDFDFGAAERGFERSIELNPRYAIGHSWFGFHLGLMGRYEEAYTECKRSIRLDPVSSLRHWVLAVVHWMGRRYDQAIEA